MLLVPQFMTQIRRYHIQQMIKLIQFHSMEQQKNAMNFLLMLSPNASIFYKPLLARDFSTLLIGTNSSILVREFMAIYQY